MSELQNNKKLFLLNNDSSRVIRVNRVRLMVGVNQLTEEQVKLLEASPHFAAYFDEEKTGDKFNWVKGFSPKDNRNKSIVELSLSEASKIIKGIYDISVLEQLEIDCKDAKIKAVILEQKKNVLPSDAEKK